jgi:hypothetical protein
VGVAHAEEIAFVPYRIDVPSKEFPFTLGAEYAKLLATGAVIAGLSVHSPRDLETDLARNNINPQGTVSAEDLSSLGKSRLIDFFVIGTLYTSASKYTAESVLFSVKKGKVISRSKVTATDLTELGERELAALFPGKARFPARETTSKVDIAFVVDCSYAVSSEWQNIKSGIMKISNYMTGGWNMDARTYIIPFSSFHGMEHAALTLKNAFSVARALENLVPKGRADEKTIERALADSVRNLSWRSDAAKQLILISNTPFPRNNRLQHFAQAARRKGIVLHTIALGDVFGEGREYLKELSSIGGGKHFDVTYHRKLFDARGEEIYAYLEAGRLFISNGYDARWKDGLFSPGHGGIGSARAKKFLKEIFIDEKKSVPVPSKMGALYEAYSHTPIIRQDELHTNIMSLCDALSAKVQTSSSLRHYKQLGRVLVYQESYSLWLDIVRPEDLEFFRTKVKSKELFFLGVSVEEKRDEPFGMRFNPRRYITNIGTEYMPELLTVPMGEIIRNHAKYASRGLFEPPIWFVQLKAERVKFQKGSDVRDE